jgi:hypothetical protein
MYASTNLVYKIQVYSFSQNELHGVWFKIDLSAFNKLNGLGTVGPAIFPFVNGHCLPKRSMPSLLPFYLVYDKFKNLKNA